jgi:hypothetical protein
MVNMGGIPYTSTDNPSVNGYRFLRFQNYIDITDITTVWSGCDYDTYTHGVDIWYYTFRNLKNLYPFTDGLSVLV